MDKKPSSPKPSQVDQIVETGAKIKRYISDLLKADKLPTMHGRPPAKFHTTYKTRDDEKPKHAVDKTEKTCRRILMACAMTLVMVCFGASLVGGILLAVKKSYEEETITVAALDLALICPRDIITRTEPGERTALVSWELPKFRTAETNTNATSVEFDSNYEPNTTFDIGVYKVVYTVQDSKKNTETCSFKVIIKDKEKPTFVSCPNDIEVVTNERGGSHPEPTWDKPAALDNAGPPKITTNRRGSEGFDIGTTVVRYTAADAAGNFDTCVFQVTIIDGTPPVIHDCPADLTVTTGQPRWPEPTATDNGRLVSFESNRAPGDKFPLGPTRVTYVAEDSAGLTARCSFTISLVDLDPPEFINCPNNITVTTNEAGSHSAPTWQTPRANDNFGPPKITTNRAEENFVLGKSTEVVYEATDASGNRAKCSFYVTIKDGTPPVVENCPSDIVHPNDPGTPAAQVYWTPPTAKDNGEFLELDSNLFPGNNFPLGKTTVVYTAVDSAGLTDECSFIVTVKDTEAPIFTYCPQNIMKSTDTSGDFDLPTWLTPRVTDNGGTPQLSVPPSVSKFEIGTKTLVQYTATDSWGNNATCNFFVTIIDSTPPVIQNCPQDITLTADPSLPTGRDHWTAPTATDNGQHVTLTSDATSGDAFRIGRTRVTYTAIDSAGLTTRCHFTVTVLDNESPVFINCPSDINRVTNAEGKYNYPIWDMPQAMDNSGDSPRVSTTHEFQMYTLNSRSRIEYVAVDGSGNNATCVFHVSVTDGTPPKLEHCPNNIIVPTDVNSARTQVNWSTPTVADNSKQANLTSDWKSGDEFPLGDTRVTITAMDPSGLTSRCGFTVSVLDEDNPIFTNCPSDIEAITDSNGKYNYPVWETPHAVDNSGHVQVTTNHDFEPFKLGTRTLIEYTATDDDNNKATCSFFVTIKDGTPPIINHCPSDITAPTDPRLPTARITWQAPITEDNSGQVTLTSNHSPGDSFPIGTTRVVYAAVDPGGLKDRCRFTITIQDTEAPVFDYCPEDIQRDTNPEGEFEYPTWRYPHAIDNSGISPDVTKTSDLHMFQLEENVLIEYTATDRAGNTAMCRFHVVIRDRTPPIIEDCPNDITVFIDPRSAKGHATWQTPIPSDNGVIVSFESNHNSDDIFPLGVTNVTYVAVDAAGLVTECHFTVMVEARCNLSITTPGQRTSYSYRFPFPVSQQTDANSILRFNFAVRSFGPIYVALVPDETSTEVYEIGLGRTKSFIRCGIQCKPRYITVRMPNLLSATDYYRFWITYDRHGLIQVGRGSDEPFLEWQDPSSTPLEVRHVGIASYHRAEWKGYLCKSETSKVIGLL